VVTDALPTFVHTGGKLWVLNEDGNPVAPASDSAAIKAVTDKIDTALVLDGAVWQYTTNALENGPSGSGLTAAETRAALGMSSANLDTQLADIPTVAELNARTLASAAYATASSIVTVQSSVDAVGVIVSAIKAKTDNLPAAPAAVGDIPTVANILTTQMTESYAADGAAPTVAQALFLTMQALTEFSIAGTTITIKKLDGTTPAATFTMDDDTSPTSRTRAS